MISRADIKQIRSLQQKKFRDQLNLFVIEGRKMLDEALTHAPQSIKTIYTTDTSFIQSSELENIELISDKELKQISSLKTPQPFLAVCYKRNMERIESPLEIVLDSIQDPGNMGTILRLAAWFGVKRITVSKQTVDIYNPKVIQASMGAIFTLSIISESLENYLAETDKPIFGAYMDGQNIYHKSLPKEAILLMGNEGNGISSSLEPLVDDKITIPKFGTGESLNVAMATGILLSEFTRN